MKTLLLSMIDLHPSLMLNVMEPAQRQPGGYHPGPGGAIPGWCVCGKCREMPTEAEKVCCEKEACVSQIAVII